MPSERLQYLFERYFEKTASEEERAELSEALNSGENKEQLMQLFAAAWDKYQGEGNIISPERSDEILNSIFRTQPAIIREIEPKKK